MHSYRSTMEGSLLTCTAYVYKHTYTSRRDAVYEGPELMEHERKQCNFFYSFFFHILHPHLLPIPIVPQSTLSFRTTATLFPFRKGRLPRDITWARDNKMQYRYAKYPCQGRKIKHNRSKRVQGQEKVPKIPAPPVFGVSLETQDKQPKLLSEDIVQIHTGSMMAASVSVSTCQTSWANSGAVLSWYPWLL